MLAQGEKGEKMPEPLNEQKLMQFMQQFLGDYGAIAHAPLVILGEELGLYKALAFNGAPMTAAELADKTHTDARYVQEWLAANAASGYVNYDPASGKFGMSMEQTVALAVEDSPAYIPGAFQVAMTLFLDQPKLAEAFRTGKGVGWHEHTHHLYGGTERFFRTAYMQSLMSSWIPALEGVQGKLEAGAKVADVGCGHGAPVIMMAQAFPKATFVGFDYHEKSVATARERAKQAGVADRVSFEVASATTFAGSGFDFITAFDAMHDMGDPQAASRHVLQALKPDGTFMMVEPISGDRLEDNLNPIGRLGYSMSTQLCTPASKAQEGSMALGAQAGESRMRELVLGGGFKSFRRASETPIHMVFEARP